MTTCPTASSAGRTPAGLAAAFERAGLQQIRWVLTAGGIIATHVGVKPAAPILTSRNGTHPAP